MTLSNFGTQPPYPPLSLQPFQTLVKRRSSKTIVGIVSKEVI